MAIGRWGLRLRYVLALLIALGSTLSAAVACPWVAPAPTAMTGLAHDGHGQRPDDVAPCPMLTCAVAAALVSASSVVPLARAHPVAAALPRHDAGRPGVGSIPLVPPPRASFGL